MHRRNFLTQSMVATALSAAYLLPQEAQAIGEVQRRKGTRLKLCLNAYSFNSELSSGRMTMDDVIDFCAEHEIDGVDMTGYYFAGYPNVPSDEVIYNLKRHAFMNGVTISGTGVRNDFSLSDPTSRKGHMDLVKGWTDVAAKLGADVVRVFSGRQIAAWSTYERTLEWMIPAFKECAAYGQERGVIIGLQHHDDFLKTADQTIEVVEAVNSPWFSVILDVGSLRQHDVYDEIEKLVPYAATWQVKEEVWFGEKAVPIDLRRLKAVIDKTGYRGFLPIEALGRDATVKERAARVANFVGQVKNVFFS
ncbi:MAG: sugar phosphate isomerase/epimerase [Acidobacteria bacterium]|nr:sugar phosphate isomerase/epimerase [Acidobacteriota bacterium]